MRRRVKVKSNGWITDVRRNIDCEGKTIWIEDLTGTEYRSPELEFIPLTIDRVQAINSDEPFRIEEIVTFDPMEMHYNPQTMTAQFFQNYNIRMTEEVIQSSLKLASDKQLQDELKRRADVRRALKGQILRCRDCIHCIQGYTSRFAFHRSDQTSVCKMRPKGNSEWDCFYSTTQSHKACEKFEPKNQ